MTEPATTAGPGASEDRSIVCLSRASVVQMSDDWYELATAEHFWFHWRFEMIRRVVSPEHLGKNVLEIGCGNGTARTQLEAAYGCVVDGCDLNLTALRMAPPGRGGLYLYDVFDRRPQWQGHFDSAVLLDTLEHIQDPEPFLRAVAWHLEPRGFLLLNVPALQSLYSHYDEVAGHARRYDLARLREELQAGSFAVVDSCYWGLSMIPVLALRKLWLRFVRRERVIRSGFEPGRFSDLVLRTFGSIERACLQRPPLGSSLVVLARKA